MKKHARQAFFVSVFCFAAVLCLFAGFARGQTVAHWRFEEGPAGSAVVRHVGIGDSSGNGNKLDPGSTGGAGGFWYRTDTAYPFVPATGADNVLSVRSSGSQPALETRSVTNAEGPGCYPKGIDIEAIMPAQFTVEAFFKPESASAHRTIVGRDGVGVADSDSKLAALYLQVRPDNSVAICFADAAGYWHEAASPAGMVEGFNRTTDPDGLAGRWYYIAAVSNGSTLKLYLANITAGTSPLLVAETNMTLSGSPNRALAKGTVSGTGWHAGGWSVGRGLYDGTKTDFARGFIDEVRISNHSLGISEFLMMPKPTVDCNPVLPAADPHATVVGNDMWILPTSGHNRRFYAYWSPDLVNWHDYGAILDFDKIPWIPDGKYAWAPCIIRKNGKVYFYYSVGPKPSHIGVAYGTNPGNLVDKGAPLLSDNGMSGFEAIDPMVFTDPVSGKSYLYAGGSAGSRLRVFEMNPDMISFAREITVNNPPYFTEGAFMHYHDGVYYLSYSNGSWNRSNYSVHYCTSNTPYGGWNYRGRILSSEGWFKGPGHHSFVYNAALDEWYIVYHRWNNKLDDGPYTGQRSTAMERIEYENGLIKRVRQTDTGVGPVWVGEWLRCDFDYDGQVDEDDLLTLADQWLTAGPHADTAPIGGDGKVNFRDFHFFSEQWLRWREGQ